MLSARVPLATLADQPRLSPKKSQSPMKSLSPIRGLALSDKENTVSARPHPPIPCPAAPHRAHPAPLSPQPPAISSARVLASKTARKIFQEGDGNRVSVERREPRSVSVEGGESLSAMPGPSPSGGSPHSRALLPQGFYPPAQPLSLSGFSPRCRPSVSPGSRPEPFSRHSRCRGAWRRRRSRCCGRTPAGSSSSPSSTTTSGRCTRRPRPPSGRRRR